MSNDLLNRGKRIRSDLQNARSQLSSAINLLNQHFVFNDDYYIQKNNIVLLDNKLSKMLNTVNYSIIPLINDD